MTALILILILVVISAFFSGSETGLTGASSAKLHQLKSDGNKRAALAVKLRESKERLIGAILLGNNAVNIAASAIATDLAIKYYGESGVFIVTIVLTLVILIFAEVLPKTYSIRNSERVAVFVAPAFRFIVPIFAPVTIFVHWIVDRIFAIFSIFSSGGNHETAIDGQQALRGAIAMHHDEGSVVKDDRDMLGGILDLARVDVTQVMVHRTEIDRINIDLESDDIVAQVMAGSHSRIPFWQGDPDNIIGMLHMRELLASIHKHGRKMDKSVIEQALKPPWFVPKTTALKDQLRAFRSKHTHVALVVDEYGALLGLVTLEDILEEIVGKIEDEHDKEQQSIIPLPSGAYVIEGDTGIREINRELDWKLPEEEANTIAGLILERVRSIPQRHESFTFDGMRFEIMRVDKNQIKSIRVTPLEEES